MKFKSTLIYYLKSLKNIIAYSNFWIIPLIFFKPVIFKTNNFSLFVRDLMDIWTVKEVIIENCYQQNKKINKNDIVIDIGAGIGDFSILAKKNGAKKVYVIEMDEKALFFFKRNITLNNVNNVIIVHKKIKSLNNFINKKINFCHFLKIDCEGCEFEIFKNISEETLKKIGYIVFEILIFNKKMTNQYAMLKQKLIKNNFLLLEIENPVHQYLKFLFAENKFKTKNEKE